MAARKGERKLEILQTLAQMLEEPAAERVTTASLAARLGVSEAALYRHFRGKAQMFEGLIEFIESTVFALVNRITSEEKSGLRQLEAVIGVLLGFAQKNRGMTRVLIGDALVNEDARLQARINQLHEKLEAVLKQSLRFGVTQGELANGVDVGAHANLLMSFVTGRWHQFAKSGFRRDPADMWAKQWRLLMEGVIA
ncbi:MAG: nucleoid occlusion factor SlmA [Burkholderiales bacterium]|nr:nucleoid occlusion factor SlmA [Burkholderiales bacterium]